MLFLIKFEFDLYCNNFKKAKYLCFKNISCGVVFCCSDSLRTGYNSFIFKKMYILIYARLIYKNLREIYPDISLGISFCTIRNFEAQDVLRDVCTG